MKKVGFKPVIGSYPKALILGSMPGEESLNKHQYYANSRNSFWEIMGRLFHFDQHNDYKEKIKYLVNNNIALWDVIEQCQREGSLDSSIIASTINVNDFGSLFLKYASIEYVFFNGGKAEMVFRKRVLPNLKSVSREIKYKLLPSTSPANARLTAEEKLEKWSKIKSILG